MLISTAGAVAHNVGQLCASVLITGSTLTFWYLPVLILSGAAMGVLTSVLLRALLPLLRKIHFVFLKEFLYIEEEFPCRDSENT
jgi:heptaprenyl diphosphate synthase